MSSIAIQTSARRIEPGASANAQPSHHACRACRIGRRKRGFGWTRDATRRPSRPSAHQRWEELSELDVSLCARYLPDRERFPSDRWPLQGASPAHTNPSMLRQRRSAGRRRAGRQSASGGNAGRDRRSRPQTGARRVSAGLGAGLRHIPAPLSAGCRLPGEQRESADGLQNEPQAIVLLQRSRAQRVVPLSARCTQSALFRKKQEPRCMARHVVCRFESSRSVRNVPTSGKEGRDD